MTDNSNYCSPLLQRLKNIQTNQEQCRLVSNDLLSKLRGSSTTFQSSISQTSEEVSSNDNVVSDISPLVKDGTQKVEEYSLNDEKFSWDGMLHNARTNSLNSVKEKLNCDGKENINPDQEEFSSAPKFSYLKKGKCLSRFKSKSLKGFRKKSNQSNASKTHLESVKLSSPQVVQIVDNKKEQNNFEKLEQLINNDSFCSTSSKVLELLQDDVTSTGCSTPVSTKLSFLATPVFNNKRSLLGTERGFKLVGRASPVRELFPFGKKSSTSNDSQIRIHFQDTGESKSYLSSKNVQGNPFELRNKYSGILKKSEQNLTTPSPSLLKVQFLEKGVKVLEYDDDESLNLTNCSDDTTDLISVSDLENLALLNFNVNVIHEDSSNVDTCKKQENCITNIVKAKCEENSNGAIYSGCSANNLEVQHESVSKNAILDFKHENRSEDETLDTQMHKMLLLSKVNDLVKEVDIFKNKNKIMEELISELKNEKRKLVDSQNIPDQNKQKNKFNTNTKPKLKTNTAHDKALLNEVSGQIQELNKKLGALETENNTLKRKVVSLERREKELRKKQTENGINNKLQSDTESVSSKSRNEKIEIKSKRYMQICSNTKQPNTVKNKTLEHNSRQYKNEMLSDNLEREMLLFQENKQNVVLQDASNILVNNNNNYKQNKLENECEERYEENRLNKIHNEVQQSDQVNEKVISKLQDKSTLFTILEESLSPPSRRNSSLSENSNTEGHLKSLKDLKGQEIRSEHNELASISKPFFAPDDTVEIIDVGKMSTLSEGEKFEDITNVIQYPNGDKEIIYPSKKVYHYSSNNCVHSLFSADGREEMQFPNGQKEIYYKDGSYLILFPDQSSKSLTKDGTEISICNDGTEIRVYKSGLKTIHFPNGQKEVHDSDCVRRIYPDGTTKIVFRDGRQETRYRNGKIRLKDSQGNVTVR